MALRPKRRWMSVVAVVGLLATAGCSENTGKGAAIGAAGGVGLGALGQGSILGNAAAGAVAGGAGGFIYDQLKHGDND